MQTAAVNNSCILRALPLSRASRGGGPSQSRRRVVKSTRQTTKSLVIGVCMLFTDLTLLSGTDNLMSAGVHEQRMRWQGTSRLSQGKVITAGWLTPADGATSN